MSRSVHTRRYDHLRNVLIACRVEAGLTQTQVAQKLRRPQSFVSKYERGERRLDVIELLEIAEVLHQDPCHIIRQIN